MKLRPMNKTLIIECEEMINEVDSPVISDALKSGLIILPDKNTIQKVSDHAKVIRAANDCYYSYKKNQRICYDQFKDTPVWYTEGKKKYRIIKEHYIHFQYGEDMKIQPLFDRVLVLLEKKEVKTRGGIILTEQAQEEKSKGRVIAVGEKSTLKIGDEVLFGNYSGDDIFIEGVKHKLLKEPEIFAVVKND